MLHLSFRRMFPFIYGWFWQFYVVICRFASFLAPPLEDRSVNSRVKKKPFLMLLEPLKNIRSTYLYHQDKLTGVSLKMSFELACNFTASWREGLKEQIRYFCRLIYVEYQLLTYFLDSHFYKPLKFFWPQNRQKFYNQRVGFSIQLTGFLFVYLFPHRANRFPTWAIPFPHSANSLQSV